jgi:NAD(P)H-dependent FMN reductase
MKICIVVGSFRKDSLNVQLAQIIQESLEKRAIR